MEEVQAVRGTVSPRAQRWYPLTLIRDMFGVARLSVYATREAPTVTAVPSKRGPKTTRRSGARSGSPWPRPRSNGEGYRKTRARLAHRGLAVSGNRVLRFMREHHLLAPRRLGPLWHWLLEAPRAAGV